MSGISGMRVITSGVSRNTLRCQQSVASYSWLDCRVVSLGMCVEAINFIFLSPSAVLLLLLLLLLLTGLLVLCSVLPHLGF